ncbi:MAG: NUDIX hydrolase [Synergistaceae bacterium]|nr:NUDIX hydrolase [Synergistaceae bacterium]
MLVCSSHFLRNIIGQKYQYRGRVLNLRIDTVLFPSGAEKIREVVEHKAAAAILAVDKDGSIHMVSQYRHAIDKDVLEIPAGIVESGEDPLETAVRELQEEIGCKPGKIEKVSEFYSSPGYSTEKIYLYYATDLEQSKLPEDDDEYLSSSKFTPQKISAMIDSGEVNDGKTIMAYFWYVSRKAAEECR